MNKTFIIIAGCGAVECGLTDCGALNDSSLSVTLFEKETLCLSFSFLQLSSESKANIKTSFTGSETTCYNAKLFASAKNSGTVKGDLELSSSLLFNDKSFIFCDSAPSYNATPILSKNKMSVFIKSFLTTLLLKTGDNRKVYTCGDLKLFIENNEAEIKLLETGAECDTTLETAVLISVFSEKNWWGDFDSEEKNKIGCGIETIKTLTSNTRKEAAMYVSNSLKWITEERYADTVETEAIISSINRLNINVNIIKSGKRETINFEKTY